MYSQISYKLFTKNLVNIIIIVNNTNHFNWWSNSINSSGLSITSWELFVGFLPPLNHNDWIEYFDLYKEIPEFKKQNFNMTLNEFKIIFWWE